MESGLIRTVAGGLANVVMVLLAAPFFEGVLRKITARIQSRQGPPLWQPYFDLLKLLGKEDIESGEVPVMQRWAVHLSLASILTVAGMVPMGFSPPLNAAGDALLLIYMLTLCSLSTLMAGLAAGSTYSLVGINREMMTLITLEPLLAVAILIGSVHSHSFSLDAVLEGSVYGSGAVPWSGLIMLVVLIFSFQGMIHRLPFDTAEAETEIMEGAMIEYSGPKLALFKYAQMAKLIVYSSLVVGLFAPWGSDLPFPLSLAAYWAKVFLVVIGVTLVAATHARYRIDQAIRYFAGLLGVALVALILAVYGY